MEAMGRGYRYYNNKRKAEPARSPGLPVPIKRGRIVRDPTRPACSTGCRVCAEHHYRASLACHSQAYGDQARREQHDSGPDEDLTWNWTDEMREGIHSEYRTAAGWVAGTGTGH